VVSIFYKDVHRSGPVDLTSVSGRLFFAANDGLHGNELWASNGSGIGTYLVKDINPGSGGSASLWGYPGGAALNNDLIFSAAGGVWKSDGSQAGTNLLWKWEADGVPQFWGADSLVYIYYSEKLWVTDGRPGNPTLLATFYGFSPKQIVNGNRLFLYLYEEGIESLWTSMGTPSSTVKLYSGPVTGLCIFNNLTYFSTEDQIWQSDGTNDGTIASITIPDGKIEDLAAAGSSLYFTVSDDEGWSIWRSDGNQTGTEFIKRINNSTDDEYIFDLHVFANKVFFSANDGIHGSEPWISDGTPNGTMLVSDIAAAERSSHPDWITPTENLVFFSANDNIHGVELWASDGTAQGTFMIEDIVPPGEGGLHYCSGDGSCPGYLTVVGKKLFFAAEEGDGDVELWALNLDK
jgi:ELWxxDGT repeat protein